MLYGSPVVGMEYVLSVQITVVQDIKRYTNLKWIPCKQNSGLVTTNVLPCTNPSFYMQPLVCQHREGLAVDTP
jgi:hypothetical protein